MAKEPWWLRGTELTVPGGFLSPTLKFPVLSMP